MAEKRHTTMNGGISAFSVIVFRFLAPREVGGEVEDEGHLHQLGGLEGQPEERDPPPRAQDPGAQAREEGEQGDDQRPEEDQRQTAAENIERGEGDDEGPEPAERRPDELPLHEEQGVLVRAAREG